MKLPLMKPAPWPIQTPPTRTASAPMIKPMVRASFDRMFARTSLSRQSEQPVVVSGRIASTVGVGVAQQQAVPIVGDDHSP